MNTLVLLITGCVFAVAHLIFNLYSLLLFPLNPFSDDWSGIVDQINWPIVLTWIELFFSLNLLVLILVTTAPYVNDKIANGPLRFSMFYYSIILIGSTIITVYRFSETGMILEGLCKSDFCPTTRFRSKYPTGCVFNNFAESSLVWTMEGIDWSKEATYGMANREELYKAYVSARNESGDAINIDSADEMILYHDCWYWGCDSECHERHDINRMAAYASLVQTILYAIILVLCLFQLQDKKDYDIVSSEDYEADDEEDPMDDAMDDPMDDPTEEEDPMEATDAPDPEDKPKLRFRF